MNCLLVSIEFYQNKIKYFFVYNKKFIIFGNMRKVLFILLFGLLSSCNPELHIVGAGMRHHNLSQNKYQPVKKRKQVKIGSRPNSLIFQILRLK